MNSFCFASMSVFIGAMCALTRFTEILLLSILVFSVITVSGQERIKAQVGDSVLLPCVYDKGLVPDTADVFWRDNNNSVVLEIIKKKPDLTGQNNKYKNRVTSFESEYGRGNFSIQMTNLQLDDSSSYECHIIKVDFIQKLVLTVSERRVGAADSTSPGAAGGAVATSTCFLRTLLPVCLCLILSALP
ncbi:ICOS ligand-like isoform X2 [Cheilinus undulatus]|uniref:ICOS ligand-like isoform X2 n=1 Tax=Cheilinus undulatus TaxID=241271 RepID=UPI001BD5F22F|nr:ICOS ligand-like isoform X2 [Cheilinus undulatus]